MSRHEFAAGEELSSDKLNKNIIAGSYDAGETINGGTLPVPVYQNTADNEFYKCDANVSTKLEFVGFSISNGTNGNAMDIQFNGIVKGFSGLTEGARYYVSDTAGLISTSKGTYEVLVGIAISTTELLIIKAPAEKLYKNGDTTKNAADASTTQNIAHGLGKIPKKVRIKARVLLGNDQRVSETVYNGTTQSSISYYGISASVVANTFTLTNTTTGNGTTVGVVTFDATNIIITWTKTSSPTGTYILLWEAEA